MAMGRLQRLTQTSTYLSGRCSTTLTERRENLRRILQTLIAVNTGYCSAALLVLVIEIGAAGWEKEAVYDLEGTGWLMQV